MEKQKKAKEKGGIKLREKYSSKGITLIALVITIVVLLILAGISINVLWGKNGILNSANEAKNKQMEAKAREKLEIVLLEAQYEKNTNIKYTPNEFLDEFIKNKIATAEVGEETVIVDGYVYELDRTVPKVGKYLGKKEELAFPKIEATPQLSEDNDKATIIITALEEKNGIEKIEIWQEGEKLHEIPYNNQKTEVTQQYEVTQNGKYIIKAYAELMSRTEVVVEGIVASVKFEPNGSEEWKKEHSTKVTINETEDKVVKAKYQWLPSVTKPEDNEFKEEQTFNSEDTITKSELTGAYYLWTMLETQGEEVLKYRSEAFNFDNEGPEVMLESTPVNYTAYKLKLTAQDEDSGIAKYEFFIKGVSQGEKVVEVKNITQEITVNNASYGENSCYVIVTDKIGNETRKEITAKTQMDTTPPSITSFTATKSSLTEITLSATANDTASGVTKFEFYVDNVKKGTQTCTATTSAVTKSVTISGLSTGSHTCKVIVYDAKNNSSNKTTSGTTKLYAWTKWNANPTTKYEAVKINTDVKVVGSSASHAGRYRLTASSNLLNTSTGDFEWSLAKGSRKSMSTQISGCYYWGEEGDGVYSKNSITVYYIKSSSISDSTITMICDEYIGQKGTSYSKGSTSYGTVTATSSTAYKSGERNSDGYWYVSISPE